MLATDSEQIISSTNDFDSEETVYRSDVSTVMAETPPHQPITAFSLALRHHSMCSHADYLYFSDIYLSKCIQEPSHIQQQQVGIIHFVILTVDYSYDLILGKCSGKGKGGENDGLLAEVTCTSFFSVTSQGFPRVLMIIHSRKPWPLQCHLLDW